MKGIRYEFGDTGIFHSLELLENTEMEYSDKMEYDWVSEKLERELPIPDIYSKSKEKYVSFFTTYGVTYFKECIESLQMLYKKYAEEAGYGTFKEVIMNIPEERIVYMDKYQYVIK